MKEFFFIEPVLAGASIHITNITPVIMDSYINYLVHYEFQYKSRGNYTWCKCARLIGAPEEGFEKAIASLLLLTVKAARELLEDPNDRGKYNYTDVDEVTVELNGVLKKAKNE